MSHCADLVLMGSALEPKVDIFTKNMKFCIKMNRTSTVTKDQELSPVHTFTKSCMQHMGKLLIWVDLSLFK